MAKHLGVTCKYLRKHYPEECNQIVKHHKEHLKEQAILRAQSDWGQVETAIKELIANGFYPSKRRIASMISKPCLLRRTVICAAWKAALTNCKLSDAIKNYNEGR